MNKLTAVFTICAAALMSSCGQSESPKATSSLTVRYASADLADIATAEALTARCQEE